MRVANIYSRFAVCVAITWLMASCAGTEPRTMEPVTGSSSTAVALDQADYEEEVRNEHFLVSRKQIADYEFSFKYLPVDFRISQDYKGKLNARIRDSVYADYNDAQYITFSIRSLKGNGEFIKQITSGYDQYDELVKYFSYQLQHDMKLIEGKDTLDCMFAHFERAYDAVPYIHFMLAFDKGKSDAPQDRTLLYNDHVLETGPVKLTILKKDFEHIPKLKVD